MPRRAIGGTDGVVIRIGRDERGVDAIEVALGRVDRDTWLEPRDDLAESIVARRRRRPRLTDESRWQPDLDRRTGPQCRMREAGRHHADDHVVIVVEAHRLSDGVTRAAERALPESIADNSNLGKAGPLI